jgi:hypothetical protein
MLGLSKCGQECVDVLSNVDHCGKCRTRCEPPDGGTVACVAGVCTPSCELGFTPCEGACVDLLSDQKNCGACKVECGGDDENKCLAGFCVSG